MPEGDTVWRAARALDRALTGQVLTATDFRVPSYATWDLTGGTVAETVSRGKHLLTRIDAERPWTLHTHLKMEGGWRILRPGQRWPRPAHTARVVLTAGMPALGQLGPVLGPGGATDRGDCVSFADRGEGGDGHHTSSVPLSRHGGISPVWLFELIGALLLAWFFWHIRSTERAGKEPLLPIRMFQNKVSNLGLVTQNVQWLVLLGLSFVVSA